MLRSFSRTLRLSGHFLETVQKRSASSTSNGGIFGPGEKVTYAGVTICKPSKFNYWAGEVIGAQLWFWFLYRAYHDWDHLYPGLPAKLDKELEAEGWDPETSED
eukprot:g1500.t1